MNRFFQSPQRHQQHQQGDYFPPVAEEQGEYEYESDNDDNNDDAATDPTPVPMSYRPPPPQPQHHQIQQQDYYNDNNINHNGQNSLLESTLFSFSVDGTTGDSAGAETLPSLALEPPSPLSRPSESLLGTTNTFDDENYKLNDNNYNNTNYNDFNDTINRVGTESAGGGDRPAKTPSIRERRQRLQQRSAKKPGTAASTSNADDTPPVHEVHLESYGDDDDSNNIEDSAGNNADADGQVDEDDMFYDSFEKVSSPNSSRSSPTPGLQSSSAAAAESESAAGVPRSYLSTPDRQVNMPSHPMTASKVVRGQQRQQAPAQRGAAVDSLTISSDTYAPQGNSLAQKRLETTKASNKKPSRRQQQQQPEPPSSDDVVRVHEAALHSLQHLKEELVIARQQNHVLKQEQKSWQEELRDLKRALQQANADKQQAETNFQRQLTLERERLESSNVEWKRKCEASWQEEKRQLESQLKEGRNKDQKEYMHRKLASDNRQKELKIQLDKMREELESALSAKANLAADLAKVESERMEIENEKSVLARKYEETVKQRDQALRSVREMEDKVRDIEQTLREAQSASAHEIDRLNASLRKANETLMRLRAEVSTPSRSRWGSGRNGTPGTTPYGNSKPPHGKDRTGSTTSYGDENIPATLDIAIADRMARLRDSAERAHLIKSHKRDVAKIKADRDAMIQKLEVEHAAALKKVSQQAESKREAEIEGLTKRLRQEYDTKLEEAEECHRKRISELQRDYLKLQEDAEESIKDAISRSNTTSQQYERESARRLSAEKALEKLRHDMEADKKALHSRHTDELEKRRQEWEAERDAMISVLQKDCNTVFESRRSIWTGGNGGRTPSPRQHPHPYPPSSHQYQQARPTPISVNSVFFPSTNETPFPTRTPNVTSTTSAGQINTGTTSRSSHFAPSPSEGGGSVAGVGLVGSGSPSIVSQTYSDLDSILRETEELVQSVM